MCVQRSQVQIMQLEKSEATRRQGVTSYPEIMRDRLSPEIPR